MFLSEVLQRVWHMSKVLGRHLLSDPESISALMEILQATDVVEKKISTVQNASHINLPLGIQSPSKIGNGT